MFHVYFMNEDGKKDVTRFINTGEPLEFQTSDEAWEFIQMFMHEKRHPRFMWTKEIPNDRQFNNPDANRSQLRNRSETGPVLLH